MHKILDLVIYFVFIKNIIGMELKFFIGVKLLYSQWGGGSQKANH